MMKKEILYCLVLGLCVLTGVAFADTTSSEVERPPRPQVNIVEPSVKPEVSSTNFSSSEESDEMKRFREFAKIAAEENEKTFAARWAQLQKNTEDIKELRGDVDKVEKQLTEALKVKEAFEKLSKQLETLDTRIPALVNTTLKKSAEDLVASKAPTNSAQTNVTKLDSATIKAITKAELDKISGDGSVQWKDQDKAYHKVYFTNGMLYDSLTRQPIDRNSSGSLVVVKGNFEAPYTPSEVVYGPPSTQPPQPSNSVSLDFAPMNFYPGTTTKFAGPGICTSPACQQFVFGM